MLPLLNVPADKFSVTGVNVKAQVRLGLPWLGWVKFRLSLGLALRDRRQRHGAGKVRLRLRVRVKVRLRKLSLAGLNVDAQVAAWSGSRGKYRR